MGPRFRGDNAATKKKATEGVAFFKSHVGCGSEAATADERFEPVTFRL
jgi:hypothetical protein